MYRWSNADVCLRCDQFLLLKETLASWLPPWRQDAPASLQGLSRDAGQAPVPEPSLSRTPAGVVSPLPIWSKRLNSTLEANYQGEGWSGRRQRHGGHPIPSQASPARARFPCKSGTTEFANPTGSSGLLAWRALSGEDPLEGRVVGRVRLFRTGPVHDEVGDADRGVSADGVVELVDGAQTARQYRAGQDQP